MLNEADTCREFEELNALRGEVNVLARCQAEVAAELDALIPSILGHAFSGNL